MKRSPLKPGQPLERRTPLRTRTPLKATASKPGGRSTLKPGTGFAASKTQRAKVADAVSIVSADGPCDPCHLVPRSHGGCDHPDCVIPLTRMEHRAFDDGDLDVLPYLIAHGMWVELGHAVTAHHYDPIRLAERCTGARFVERSAA